jgi:hypothetical protein
MADPVEVMVRTPPGFRGTPAACAGVITRLTDS